MPDSLEGFLERVAAGTPTPGGGTVSAVCGALSVALSRMVANLAVGKLGYEAVQPSLVVIEARGKALQTKFLHLAAEDAKAYEAVMAAMRFPKASDEERAKRKEAMQAAYKRAAQVPLETIRSCIEALELAKVVSEKGNRNALTDVGVAVQLAQAAMRGAALNVRVNLAAIADADWREAKDLELKSTLERGAHLAHAVDDLVESRI